MNWKQKLGWYALKELGPRLMKWAAPKVEKAASRVRAWWIDLKAKFDDAD